MKKYNTPAYYDNATGQVEFGSVDVYLASEVDARIAELEKALHEAKQWIDCVDSDQYSDKFDAVDRINSVL